MSSGRNADRIGFGRTAVGRSRRFFRAVVPVVLLGMTLAPAEAQIEVPQPVQPPFVLPFLGPPGPDRWLFAQPYGNTVFAYRFRSTVYAAGQGMHFGIDLAARCGTPVVAIGDGVVWGVDVAAHGAGPHNLLIEHENGTISLYGHLLSRPSINPGTSVRAGETVAESGDPDLTCTSRPHLHLEIRDAATRRRAFNPTLWIDADWERIALAGEVPIRFQQDLDQPLRWQSLLDQPEVEFGQTLLNNYASPWPIDW